MAGTLKRARAVVFWMGVVSLAAVVPLFRFGPERAGWVALSLFYILLFTFAIMWIVAAIRRTTTRVDMAMLVVLVTMYWVVDLVWKRLYP